MTRQHASDTRSAQVRHALNLLWATVPTPAWRRVARGRLRTCRELGEHIRKARQLHDRTTNAADHEAIDALVEHCERLRAELSDGGRLAKCARVDAERRKACRTTGGGTPG